MSTPVDVLCALTGALEESFAQEFASAGREVRVVRRCGDVAELVAAARAGLGTVALVAADLPGLDRPVVAELDAAGVRLLAVADDTRPWLTERMTALGVRRVVPAHATPEAIAAAVGEVAAQSDAKTDAADARPGSPGGSGGASDPGAGGTAGPGAGATPASIDRSFRPPSGQGDGEPARRGSLVAVWGAGGAPGRTSIAVNLATELALGVAGAGGSVPAADVLLVDADTHHPGLAQQLALLDEAAGLAVCARAAGRGRLDAATLAAHAPLLDRRLRVLSGIGRADRWAEAPGPSLDALWERAREIAQLVVVDCAASVERDEALSYDTRAPQRNAATLSVLGAADTIVVVGAADPVGVQRLVQSLEELREGALAPRAELVVVVTKVRRGVVGPQPTQTLRQALARYGGVDVDVLVPYDAPSFDAAVLAGRTLAEVAPHAAARRAIADVALRVVAHVPAPTAGG
ncbi:MAG: AAA family ATPase [Cellulomonadaceae bacterium]